MTKKELKEEIFLALHNKRMLYKQPKPYQVNITDRYIAEVNSMTMIINITYWSLQILSYEIGNTLPKYTLEDIYNELKTKG